MKTTMKHMLYLVATIAISLLIAVGIHHSLTHPSKFVSLQTPEGKDAQSEALGGMHSPNTTVTEAAIGPEGITLGAGLQSVNAMGLGKTESGNIYAVSCSPATLGNFHPTWGFDPRSQKFMQLRSPNDGLEPEIYICRPKAFSRSD